MNIRPPAAPGRDARPYQSPPTPPTPPTRPGLRESLHRELPEHVPDRQREPVPAPLLLNVAEAALLLRLSQRTVWTLTAARELPHIRIGKRVLYPLDQMRQWIAVRVQGGTATIEEPQVRTPIRPQGAASASSAVPHRRIG